MLKRAGALSTVGCVAVMLAIAGCGSSSGSGGSAYVKQPAAKIFSDTLAATRASSSYQFSGTLSRSGHQESVKVAFSAPSSVSATIDTHGESAQIVVVPGGDFINANAAFYAATASQLSAAVRVELAGKWVQIPNADAGGLTDGFTDFTPQKLATCLAASFPKPTVAGTQETNGQSAVKLASAGAGGSGAASLLVATASPHHLLQFTRSGKRTSAGSDPCAQGPGGVGTVALTGWNATTISAPAHATKLP